MNPVLYGAIYGAIIGFAIGVLVFVVIPWWRDYRATKDLVVKPTGLIDLSTTQYVMRRVYQGDRKRNHKPNRRRVESPVVRDEKEGA